ncbi:calcium-binding and coiled-coil domain-containing protein 1-like [Coregonus clupeaformis]|uniref:calcium-binding and coiled-coil domain-containing protein 1-like n=1 Tax=Coregonus clupeaformis TaxID=59861 RepID=UPI001BDF7439|nr:calcium-binding and coiled-coil domain-containing protein 1-like [Coregonus clupeaformis]
MEKVWRVEFRNVGSSYFPQSRVECHYSISSQHTWASHDWVGLFKVGWSSVKDYHTFVWALAPAGYQEGTDVNCCVHFQASYLPKPSSQQYQFVYVDGKGEVCSASPQFTFSDPKPLEDLVTLEEGAHGEEGGTDMLLVVPRAELLQSRLQECLRERAELLHAREAAERMKQREKEMYGRAREAWDRGREELERNISELKEELRESRDRMEEMERRKEEVEASGEALTQEKSSILAKKAASEQRIRELEDDIKALTLKAVERETELERMKERAKKQAVQMMEEEKERKVLQLKLEQTEGELRSLSAEFQGLRSSLAQRDTHALQLRDTITTLTHRLNMAQRKEAESKAALAEMWGLRERQGASERCAEGLKEELCALVAQRDQGQTELHQARLQAAQLTLQLADSSLTLREGRAHWAQERQSLQRCTSKDRERLEKLNGEMQRMEEKLQEERMEREKVEVELGREKDCNRVQLSETRRELQELKASLRVVQKEKEQLLLEKQDLMEYMRQVEQRMEAVADAKWSAAMFAPTSLPDSPVSDSEDENPEALQPPRQPSRQPPLSSLSSRPLAHYSLCDPQAQPDSLLPSTPPSSPRDMSRSLSRGGVVISQPAPLSLPRQSGDTLTHSSESEEEGDTALCGGHSSGEETALLLPETTVLSDLADTSQW